MLKQCLDIVHAIPGALPNISTFVGQKREYDHKFCIPDCPRSSDQEGVLMWYCSLDSPHYDQEHFINLICDKMVNEHYRTQIIEGESGGVSFNMDSYH